ncbi:hypothetical protein [Schlesneria sp.]|uniref:hypothetical protein n=1 Tax=Schlesneria sp. TaxID=2762018 RepID=UPI002F1719FE
MKMFVKITVERKLSHWTAWFNNAPQITAGGWLPGAAIQRLLELVDDACFSDDDLIPVEADQGDGHLEFLVPLRERSRIPVPSVN